MNHDFENMFLNDIKLLFGSIKNIDYFYSEGKPEVKDDIKTLKKLIKDFNLKYPYLYLMFKDTGIQLKIDFYIKDTFSNVIQETMNFQDLCCVDGKPFFKNSAINTNKNYIELSYGDEEQNTLNLEKHNEIFNDKGISEKKEIVKLIYEYNDMFNKESPEFQLCLIYAKKDFKEITINANFSFDIDFFLREGKGYTKFDKIRQG